MFVVDNLVSYQEVKAIVPNLCQEINDEIADATDRYEASLKLI